MAEILGTGGAGPWENRTHRYKQVMLGPFGQRVVAAHLNRTYSVQRAQHPEHPGVDHLVVRRHDECRIDSWTDLQRIKDQLAPDGGGRTAIEVYPPTIFVVDNYNLRHLWVLPLGETAPFSIHDRQPGAVPV